MEYRPMYGPDKGGYYISAYGIAVKHGFEGTEEEWLASLKGEQGDTGATGAAFRIMGWYPDEETLKSEVTDPEVGDIYMTGTGAARTCWIYRGVEPDGEVQPVEETLDADDEESEDEDDGWEDIGDLTGPKGDTGDTGAKGDKGDTGRGIQQIVFLDSGEVKIYYDDGTTAVIGEALYAALLQLRAEAEAARNDAQTAQIAAEGFATYAQESAKNAAAYETAARGYSTAASAAQTAAETAQGKAEDAQTAAETAQEAAEDAQEAAEAAQAAAEASAEDIQEAADTIAAMAIEIGFAYVQGDGKIYSESASSDWVIGTFNRETGEETVQNDTNHSKRIRVVRAGVPETIITAATDGGFEVAAYCWSGTPDFTDYDDTLWMGVWNGTDFVTTSEGVGDAFSTSINLLPARDNGAKFIRLVMRKPGSSEYAQELKADALQHIYLTHTTSDLEPLRPLPDEVDALTEAVEPLLPLPDEVDELSDTLNARTVYPINSETFGYSYGGITKEGRNNTEDDRLRFLLGEDGGGAVWVSTGSTITAGTGFKFNVAEYDWYEKSSKNHLTGYRSMAGGTYTADHGCYIRVGVGTTADYSGGANATLWAEDQETGVKSLTQAGEDALEGIEWELISGEVKDRIEALNTDFDEGRAFDSVEPLQASDVAIDAVSYHAMWDEIVDWSSDQEDAAAAWKSTHTVMRTLLGNIHEDEDLPVYLYTIRGDKNYIATVDNIPYTTVWWGGDDMEDAPYPWSEGNHLYDRPKIFLTGAIHGHERASTAVLLDLAKRLIGDPRYNDLLNAFDWYIIPLVSPWGFSYTAYKNGTPTNGTPGDLFNQDGTPKTGVTFAANTETVHNGCRYVPITWDGDDPTVFTDPNRDFADFETEEARIVRDAVQNIIGDGRKFLFSIDEHQSQASENRIAAFLSMPDNTPQTKLDTIHQIWMASAGKAERDLNGYYDLQKSNTVYPWEGTDNETVRNYMGDFAEYAMCFEGSQTCAVYGGSSTWSNSVAATVINTIYHGFLRAMGKQAQTLIVRRKTEDLYTATLITDTVTGAVASITDGADGLPVQDLTISILPVQAGSGDPSPDNVRPITGWTGASIVHSPTLDAADGKTYTISWQTEAGTIYGGTLDVTTGLLTVTRKIVTLTSSGWSYNSSYPNIFANNAVITANNPSQYSTPVCDTYKGVAPSTSLAMNTDKTIKILRNSANPRLCIKDTRYTDTTSFGAAVDGVQVVFLLKDYVTYQLAPMEIRTLLGANNIWADTGETTLRYTADTKRYIQRLIAANS